MEAALRVLYVDDEPDLLETGKLFLEQSGDFTVTTALSAPEAVRLFEQQKFDAIISDYQMPEMDGIQFLVEVRKRFGPVPFILFTGKGSEDIVIRALNNGADFYLQKGGEPQYQFTELVSNVRQAISQKRANEALVENEQRFNLALEGTGAGLWDWDMVNDRVVYSAQWKRMLGYEVHEVENSFSGWKNLWHPDDSANIEQALDDYLAGKTDRYENIHRLRHKDGSWRWIETRGGIIKDSTGKPIRWVGTNIDITGSKKVEDALRESEARVRLSVRSANIGLWDWDLVADTVYFSPEWKGQIGYRDEELPNLFDEWQCRLHPDDLVPTLQTLHAYLANPEGRYEDEFRLMHKDGSYRWINSHADVIRDADGKLVRMLGGHIDITERKQAEEALRKSEECFRRYFDMPLQGIAITSTDKGWLQVNDQICSLLGYTRDEIFRMTWAEITHPDDLAADVEQFNRLLSGEIEQYTLDKRFIRKDGTDIWTRIAVGCVRKPNGNADYIVAVMEDITGRKRAELERVSTLESLKNAHRLAHIGTWDWIMERDMVTWSEELYNITGWDPTLPAPDYAEQNRVYTPASWDLLGSAVTRALTSGEPYNLELELVRPDGSTRWVNAFGGVKRDGKSKVIGLHGTVQDITERKVAEGALRESEARHRTILEIAMDGFWLVDMQGRLLEVNDAYCRMSGYNRNELLDMHIMALEVSESADETADHIRKTMTQGEDRFETLHRRKDGSIFDVEISVQYRPVEGGRLTAFLRDITSRRKMEEELRESESFNRNLVENLPDYIIVYGAEGKILYVNPATERALGYRLEELIGTSLFTYIAPDHRENAILQMKSRNEGSEVPAYEIDIVSKDGHRRSVVVKGVPVQYHDSPAVLILLSDITDRKRADNLIRTTLQRLDTLISSLYAGVMTVSEDGIVEHVNSAFCDLFNLPDAPGSLIGLAAPAMIEKIIDAYVSPAEMLTRIQEVTARGEPVRGEEVTMRDGRVVLVDYIPVIDADGQRRGRIWHHQDITRRKRADEALQLQGEILEKMAEGVAMVRTGDGVIVYANPRYEFMFGYDHNELIGRQVSSINAPGERDPEVVANEIITSLTQLGIWSGEVHNIRKDGTTFWCYANVSTYEHPQYGQVWVSVQMDISGRKKAEEELVKNRALLNSIIQGTTDAIYVKDLKGRYLLFNPAAELVTGKKSEDVLGNDDTFLFPAEEAAIVMNRDHGVMAAGKLMTYEEMVTNSQGMISTFLSTKGPIFDKNGTASGLFGIARDITERKLAEAALRDTLKEKEVLLKEVHHRVKNNLQIVSGLIFLQSTLTKDLETKNMLSACRNRIVSMALLHENLFQISDFSSVAMRPYVNNLAKYLADSYDTEQYLTFEVDIPDDINLDIDTGIAVGIIITELSTNSIKYAFPPGQAGRVEISLHRSGEGMLLCVRDNGKGMPKGYDLASNPGLGAKLVINLVRQVQGTMDVKSNLGTTICIAFTGGIPAGKGQVPVNH